MIKKRSGIMLCYPLEERRLINPKFQWANNFPVIVQPKLDGIRCRAICNGHLDPILLSSTENIIKSVPHINDALKQNCIHRELDGELYIHGESFETINSIVSRTINIHDDHSNIEFHVFDTVTKAPQLERLADIKRNCSFKGLPIKIVPCEIANSFKEIMNSYEKFLDLEYEGIIVRHKLAAYVRKRSSFILKFKPKKSDIYKIVGTTHMISDDKSKLLLGAIICTSDEGTVFSVGSGMTEEFRINNYENSQQLIGKYCKISYQHMTAKQVPRFPIFVSILDKNPEEDDFEFSEGIL